MSEINPVSACADKLTETATAVILDRCGMLPVDQQLPNGFQQNQNSSLCDFLAAELKAKGVIVDGMSREDIALKSMQLSHGLAIIPTFASSGDGSVRRPGDTPNLLSNIAGKMLDQAIELSDATYSRWTDRLLDTPNFQPKTIIGLSGHDELDLVEDGDEAGQLSNSEEVVGWIKVDRYAGKTGLTPVMVANDDLDAFSMGLMKLAGAHENTLNRLCVELIATNPTLLDGNNLFDAGNHNNDVVAGDKPTAAQGEQMWERWYQQTDVGANGTMRTPPKIILYPAVLDYSVKQAFSPFSGMVETKVAQTDANLNVLRGQFDFVSEPELDSYSQLAWYWLANPKRRRAFVHMFQTGFGAGGRRTSWFDPDRETRYYKSEGRFGAANAGFRGVLRNRGQDES